MAKKKDFGNVVDESFEEGYKSEPGTGEELPVVDAGQQETPDEPKGPALPKLTMEELKRIWVKKDKERTVEESEIFFRLLQANDPDALSVVIDYEERSTYYLTDVHRACVDIMSHEEGLKKNDIVVAALNAYFSAETKRAAEELVVARAIKKMARETGQTI